MIVFGNEGAAPVGPLCDYCQEPREGTGYVLWVLANGIPIFVHGACAARLGTHLIGDARECELAEGEHPWPTRARWVAERAQQRQAEQEGR